MIDGHHFHEAIREMDTDLNTNINWTSSPLLFFLTLRTNGNAFSSMAMMKSSTFPYTDYSATFPGSTFLALLFAVAAYFRTFNCTYRVPLVNTRAVDIRKDMQSKSFITFHSTSITTTTCCGYFLHKISTII